MATRSKKTADARHNHLVLLSGGPDSATLLRHVLEKEEDSGTVLGLHFHTGIAKNALELAAARSIAKDFKVPVQVMDVSHFVAAAGGAELTIHSEAHVLRFGTAVLLSMAAAFANQNRIASVWVALHKDDAQESPEYGEDFLQWMNNGLAQVKSQTRVQAPFHIWPKSRVLKYGASINVPFAKTWSCLCPVRKIQCGTCGACRARREGFEAADIEDKTRYAL